jgi:hypothetical protein
VLLLLELRHSSLSALNASACRAGRACLNGHAVACGPQATGCRQHDAPHPQSPVPRPGFAQLVSVLKGVCKQVEQINTGYVRHIILLKWQTNITITSYTLLHGRLPTTLKVQSMHFTVMSHR